MLRVGSYPSGSKVYSDEALDRTYHFKWKSIRNLLYLTFTYAGNPLFFHIFSDITGAKVPVFHYTVISIVIGMTYMCADLFIKQYTGRLDWDQNLCPILKDITFSLTLQSTLFCSLTLRYTGDGSRYLASSFASTPIWSVCDSQLDNSSRCMTSRHILQHCENPDSPRKLIKLNITSVHIYYTEYMTSNLKGAWTWRFFVSAVIWTLNFCLTTIPHSVVLKIYKHVAYLKHVCTILSFIYLAISSKSTKEAFFRLMKIDFQTISESVAVASLVYGVGMIGFYNFGSVSPYTMVDNAVIIFTTIFIILSAIRSMTVYILILGLSNCIEVNPDDISYHYILFVIMPLATEFLYGQKLINITLYLYVILSLIPCLMLFTVTMTRLYHSEFPSIKPIYIQGVICLFQFCVSIPLLLVDRYFEELRMGLLYGLFASVLYLGGLRMAIIMWIYGVNKFSTDINFWLGFSPTKFWTLCWSALPALLLITSGYRIFKITQEPNNVVKTCALAWFLTTVVIELALQTRTIVRYVMQNNLMGAFRSNKKYGPFDRRDRNRRRKYDEIIDNRKCFHDCMSLDEEIECNHMPLMNTGDGQEGIGPDDSNSTLTKMYENIPSTEESIMHIVAEKPNAKEKQA